MNLGKDKQNEIDMSNTNDFISENLQIQWQDHFHMRDQTWNVLKYSIPFLLALSDLN